MRTPTSTSKAVAVAASLLVASSATASAVESPIPLGANYRACDYTQLNNVPARGNGWATAYQSSQSGQVVARVELLTGEPDTRYDVRVIQLPRASIGCGPGAAGVDLGSFVTNGSGAGSTTVRGPIASGKTGAWVILERAGSGTQTPAEVYTSDFIGKF